MKNELTRGYTLIEIIVAVGLFALVMTLASGAYLLMIDLNRQTQGISTGIDSLSFALETMTRSIRTGTLYNCGDFGGDCLHGANKFSFRDSNGADTTYTIGQQGSLGTIVKNGSTVLTDPSVNISSLLFYVSGTGTISSTLPDYLQPHVTIVVSGTVSSGPGKSTQSFTIETGATMRGVDLTVVGASSAPHCTLTADSSYVVSGGQPRLSWTTSNTTSFSIDQGVGLVTPVAYSLTPVTAPPISVSTTYTGTATNATGSAKCTITVTVQ